MGSDVLQATDRLFHGVCRRLGHNCTSTPNSRAQAPHGNLQDTETALCFTCASSSLGVHSLTSPESSELSSHLSLCVKVMERIGAVCACAVHTCISSQLSLCISLFKLKSYVCTLSRCQYGSPGQE